MFNGSEVDFENQEAVQVLKFFRRIYAHGYFLKTLAPGNDFLRGRVATQFTGPCQISYLERNAPPGFEYDVMPLPVPDRFQGPSCMYGDEKSIIIFNGTRHPTETWQFAQHLISPANDFRLLAASSVIPIRKDLFRDPLFAPYLARNPKVAAFARQIPYIRRFDPVENLPEIFDAISQEYEACVIYGARTPEAAVRNMARQVKVIMEWNKQ